MLIISKGKAYYTFSKEAVSKSSNDDKTKTLPLPKVGNPSKLSFDSWNKKYQEELSDIGDMFTYFIRSFGNDTHLCHVHMDELKQSFIKIMYHKSSNSNKRWIT